MGGYIPRPLGRYLKYLVLLPTRHNLVISFALNPVSRLFFFTHNLAYM